MSKRSAQDWRTLATLDWLHHHDNIPDAVRLLAAARHKQICDVAFQMMRSASGTRFTIEPLTFVGFPNDEARAGYYLNLIHEFKTSRKGRMDERALALFHVERLAAWWRAEMERQLTHIAAHDEAKCYYAPSTRVVS
jgi:hypothetical protein